MAAICDAINHRQVYLPKNLLAIKIIYICKHMDRKCIVKYRPKVLLVADLPNWAYHHICLFIMDTLEGEYDFYVEFTYFHKRLTYRGKLVWALAYLYPLSNTRALYREAVRWRRVRRDRQYDAVFFLGCYMEMHTPIRYLAKHVIKGIYTDSFPPLFSLNEDSGIGMDAFVAKYLGNADMVVCGAPSTAAIYSGHLKRMSWANAAYDEDLFSRLTPKMMNTGFRLVVGWTGSPLREFKGFGGFVVPAVELARVSRPGIELKTRFSGPLATLPRFYDDVDLLVIASTADTGPSAFGEAAMCDVPSVSTRIGFPSSVIQHGINGFFVERDVESIARRIIDLYDDRELLYKMSLRIRKDFLEIFGCNLMAGRWRRIFSEIFDGDEKIREGAL